MMMMIKLWMCLETHLMKRFSAGIQENCLIGGKYGDCLKTCDLVKVSTENVDLK